MEFASNSGGAPVAPKKQRNLKGLLVILVLVILAAAAGIFGWLYWAERDSRQQLEASMNAQIESNDDSVASPDIAPAQARYQAEVGKFTLTLPSTRYIVVDLDGGFEGGPATRLSVGTQSQAGEQTIVSPDHANVEVFAVPLNGSSYDERRDGELGDLDNNKLEPVTIDGVTAEVYQLDGLFQDKKIFFTKGDIFYMITVGNADGDEPQAMLDEVIKGFKFD